MSINALAIIFAPTCVRLDGVPLMHEKAKRSFLSPNTYKKPKKLFKSISYDSSQLFQLQLIKDTNSWTRIFEFMMTYPEVFASVQTKEHRVGYSETEGIQQIPFNLPKFLRYEDYSSDIQTYPQKNDHYYPFKVCLNKFIWYYTHVCKC
jgi:hypothetical protein